jgi:hypothetical protein
MKTKKFKNLSDLADKPLTVKEIRKELGFKYIHYYGKKIKELDEKFNKGIGIDNQNNQRDFIEYHAKISILKHILDIE